MTYRKSNEWLAYAERVTPGASQTGSKAPGRAGPLKQYPLFADRGAGCFVWDVDGLVYYDLIASLAAVGMGHADERVTSAVIRRLKTGSLLSLPLQDEAVASEKLCALTGWATAARWVKTGSEATEAAVRIARCATGRSRVLTVASGYHSWHSWFQAVKPLHPGVPNAMTDLITGMLYGQDLSAFSASDYAAVILEASPIDGGGNVDWLEDLRRWASRGGALLIFDEVVWGLRLSGSGGTGWFGVTPDLACYGKALGNGVPVGAVVGGMELMRHASVVSGTFGGDGLGLAAAISVLLANEASDQSRTMWDIGRLFSHGCNDCSEPGVDFACVGYPVHPVLRLHIDGVDDAIAMSVFLQRLAAKGVLYHPAGGNIMTAITESDMASIVTAVALALKDVADEHRRGHLMLDGEPYRAAFTRAR